MVYIEPASVVSYAAPAPAVFAAPVPVVVYVTPVTVVSCVTPAPAFYAVPAPEME